MSSATTSTNSTPDDPQAPPARKRHDPEDFRMSIGEHLTELRNRLFLGAAGFLIAFIVCFIFGTPLSRWFIHPFILACVRNKINPQMYTREVAESFMTYIKIIMIIAASAASPWMLYQLWQFIAAGLYPKERKYITKYLPLSIGLLVSGMAFLYYYVLPLMLEFFLLFAARPGHPSRRAAPGSSPSPGRPSSIPSAPRSTWIRAADPWDPH